ncbi:hypothetical protein [Hydrogenophaga sp. RAC07]|uniref:hypothetical protein n=1 Tax=Hydrogenophaga sp. RAC07 TaxID=1842537 RepID=UPI00083CC78E|nr:hypothetical protein [Hydrogenophaga sp. RAC07]
MGDHAYVLGFAQAAMALLHTAIEPPRPKESAGSFEDLVDEGDVGAYMDALVYPICFSARHHIELFLKRQIARLAEVRDIDVNRTVLRDHKLAPLLDELFRVCDKTDSTLRERLELIEGAIRELDAFDSQGQTFRYRRSNEKELHLQEVSHINLGTLEAGLKRLFAATEDFDNYVGALVYEYQQGSFTSKLSREKLVELAKALPPRSSWTKSSVFDAVKQQFRQKYDLSSNDFQKAVNRILAVRGLSGYVDVELALPHLTPEQLTKLVALEVTKEELDAIPKEVWRVLETVGEVGRPHEYPELFDRVMGEASTPPAMPKESKPAAQPQESPAEESEELEEPKEEKVDWGKLEYLEDKEPKNGRTGNEGQEDEDDEGLRDPSPPDVVRTMFRARTRFINGLKKLQQPTLLAALDAGEAARAKHGGDEMAEFEKMVRKWYYLEVVAGAKKY